MQKKEFHEFIEQFKTGNTEKQLEQLIEKAANQLTDEQKEQFKPLLDARSNDALHRAREVVAGVRLALKLEPVTDYISVAYLSRRFFGKSRSWLHNRLQGYKNNGKPDTLSGDEINTLQNALLTLSDEIKTTARRLT